MSLLHIAAEPIELPSEIRYQFEATLDHLHCNPAGRNCLRHGLFCWGYLKTFKNCFIAFTVYIFSQYCAERGSIANFAIKVI